jgi:DNA polymerase-3 subunit alpha
VVIAPGPITDYVPIYKSSKGEITTQYPMKSVEDVGLLKVDFLGLRTLTVLHDAIELVRSSHSIEIDLDSVSLDDAETYGLFSRGETIGIFQFESTGMRDYLRKLRPSSLDDLIAMNALYRPGPLGSNMVDDYIDRKHGRKQISYAHPALKPIVGDTYGIIVYQEQVMRIASELAGFSLGEADLLRRAMGKKDADVMEEQRETFLEGAGKKKIDGGTAESIFELMAYFAGYGFNKSHSTGYALIAYQTAYLKSHYPAEFMAATLSSEMGNSDRVVVLIEECRRLGLEVAQPDVNESAEKFTVTGKGVIRFGLGAVKNVGHSAIQAVIEARSESGRFETLTDLLERTDLKSVNKRVMESLVAAGSCDSLGGHRSQLMGALSRELEGAQRRQTERERGQVSMFDAAEDGAVLEARLADLPELPEWSMHEMLAREKEALGFYVSGHPLERYRDEVNAFTSNRISELEDLGDNAHVTVAGIITEITRRTDRNGNPMAFVRLEDFTGSTEAIVFSEPYEKHAALLIEESMVLARGGVSRREGEFPKIRGEEFVRLADVREELTRELHLLLVAGEGEELAAEARQVLSGHPGEVPVYIHLEHGTDGPPLRLRAGGMKVNPTGTVLDELKAVLGEENVWVSA